MEGGNKAYDVVLIDEGSGGVLLFKGADALLSEKDRQCWSVMALAVSESANLLFEASSGEATEPFRVRGNKRVPYDNWCHVALTMSKVNLCLPFRSELSSCMLTGPFSLPLSFPNFITDINRFIPKRRIRC